MTTADSVMMAIPELRWWVRGTGDESRAAARSGVSIRAVIARSATASIERTTKHKYKLAKIQPAAEKWMLVTVLMGRKSLPCVIVASAGELQWQLLLNWQIALHFLLIRRAD